MELSICFFCSAVIHRDDPDFDTDWLDAEDYTTCPARGDQQHTPTDPNEES